MIGSFSLTVPAENAVFKSGGSIESGLLDKSEVCSCLSPFLYLINICLYCYMIISIIEFLPSTDVFFPIIVLSCFKLNGVVLKAHGKTNSDSSEKSVIRHEVVSSK